MLRIAEEKHVPDVMCLAETPRRDLEIVRGPTVGQSWVSPVLQRKTARGNWARFIKKVFELDPLLCPDCGGVMKIISFIEEPRVIRAILIHLALWDVPRARPPPVAAGGTVDFEYVPCED